MRGPPLPFVLALTLVCGAAREAFPQVEELPDIAREFNLTADEVAYERGREVYEASGNVRIEQPGGRVLIADWIAVNARTRIGVASGNVVLREGDDVIEADFAAVDIDTLVAMATHASLDTPESGFKASGDAVARTGVNTYRVQRGTFTTCRCPPDGERRPWEVDVGDADIRVGGYAVARDVTFKALGVPLLYTPWMILPLRTQRQTGFLVPLLEIRDGVNVQTPFFWALRDNVNALLRPIYFSDRGFKIGAETEYVFGEEGFGYAGAAILPDDDDVDRDDSDTPYSDNRWAYWLRHEHPLGPGIRLGADVNQVSDNDYALDFDDLGSFARQSRFLASSAWASYARGWLYADGAAYSFDDLQSPNDLDRDGWVLQRRPDVHLANMPLRLGPVALFAGLDTRYTYFYHQKNRDLLNANSPVGDHLFFDTGPDGLFNPEEPFFDALLDPDPHDDDAPLDGEGDGVFQEGELLADFGHRVDVQPRVTFPLRLGWVETLSEAGFRGTLYDPRNGDAGSRALWTGRFDARMHLARSLALRGRRLRHLVEPSVQFGFITPQNQDRNPLFIPNSAVRQSRLVDGDMRVLLRNPSDRIPDEKLLEFALGNRLYAAPPADGAAARLLADFRVGAGYDFEEGHGANIYLDGGLHPRSDLSFDGILGIDPHENVISEAGASLSWRSEVRYALPSSVSDRRHLFNLSYRYLRDIPQVFEAFQRDDDVFEDFEKNFDRINQFSAEAKLALVRQLDLFASGYVSLESSSSNAGTVGFAFLSACGCWELIAALEQRTRPSDTTFMLELRLAGFGVQPGAGSPRAEARAWETSVDGGRTVWEAPAP